MTDGQYQELMHEVQQNRYWIMTACGMLLAWLGLKVVLVVITRDTNKFVEASTKSVIELVGLANKTLEVIKAHFVVQKEMTKKAEKAADKMDEKSEKLAAAVEKVERVIQESALAASESGTTLPVVKLPEESWVHGKSPDRRNS